jgi:murein DD-endopeptidase MepM/ murein hydrolase activator NlpD
MRALPPRLSLLVLLVPLLLGAAAPQPATNWPTARLDDITVEARPITQLALVFPQDAEVTHFDDTWGHARSGGRRHKGSDLMAPKHTPVYAVADGVVSIMRKSGLAGYWIGIEHAGGIESWYMHLNNDTPGTDNGRARLDEVYAPGIEIGSFVTAGQLIGYVGDSGNAERSGSHTHFELRVDGRAIDPYPLLAPAHERALEIARLSRLANLIDHVD